MNDLVESQTPKWQFSIHSLVLLSALAAWIFATTRWLNRPYSWIAIVPLVVVLPTMLITRGKSAIGGVGGALFFVILGDLVIVRWTNSQPQYIQSIAVVAAFGFGIGASAQTMLLKNFALGMGTLVITLLAFAWALQL